jgi:hypothetical protein
MFLAGIQAICAFLRKDDEEAFSDKLIRLVPRKSRELISPTITVDPI